MVKVEGHAQQGPDRLPPAAGKTAAERALAEAAARQAGSELARSKPELGGRGGLEPVRFGDWEVNGLASDF